jgi:ABC-type glycerol-3-phosphate transport system substrate-binding protein
MISSEVSRRTVLKTTALGSVAVIAAPYVHGAYAAGKLTLGVWDHWVPGANNTLTKLCTEWGEKNKVEINIDYITSQGDKDLLTASAEAQARTGHDIMSHRAWQIQVHRRVLEPVDDVIKNLIAKAGPISPVSEFLAKADGKWYGIPTTVGSQIKPCCSRLDLYKQHTGIDLIKIFPADAERDQKLVDTWTWDLYLKTAEQLFKAGFPVGMPMGQTSDAIDTTGAMFRAFGSVMIDEKDSIKVNSNETRAALEYFKKLMAFNPPEVYAWDDAGNNRWLISGKGSSIQNPPSAWAVAKRDNLKVAEQCWTHDMPRGPAGRFVGQLPFFYGVWNFSQNKPAAKELLQFISEKEQSRQLVAASSGYDLPSFKSYYDFDTWRTVEPPKGTVFNYPPRGDQTPNITGYPARPDIAAQIYNQSIHTVMVAKVTQGNEPIDKVIKWAEGELAGFMRT